MAFGGEVTFRGAAPGCGSPKNASPPSFKVFATWGFLRRAQKGGKAGWGCAPRRMLMTHMRGGMGGGGERGKGSTFHFTIVADEVEALERAAADREQPELAGKRVLIVDDNASNRLLLKLQTERWGMRARDTNSPAVALEWIVQGDPFDVALLDYQMPEMDGIALA